MSVSLYVPAPIPWWSSGVPLPEGPRQEGAAPPAWLQLQLLQCLQIPRAGVEGQARRPGCGTGGKW